jgi:hypothetical protein
MTDPMDQDAVGRSGEGGQARITGFALCAPELHFDEFMVVERSFGLGDDRGRDAGVADEKHGIQCVTQTPQILALTF